MRTEQFSAERGDRKLARDVAIVITDGASDHMKEHTIPEAQLAHNRNIHVIAIGITDDVNENEIKSISSAPHQKNVTYFLTRDFLTLNNVLEDIFHELCFSTS